MTQENTEVGTQIPGEANSAQANPQEFEAKQSEAITNRAVKFGWKPKEEYEGDPADWRPAKEFIERQSFFDKIKSVKDDLYESRKENRQLKKDIDQIKEYVKKMSEVEYARAVADLQVQKDQAVEAADSQAVRRIDTQIDQLKTSKAEIAAAPQVEAPAGPPPEFHEWVDRNKWYNEDPELRSQADEFGYGILAKNRGMPAIEVLRQVEVKVKKMYPEKFPSQRKAGAQSVESGGVSNSGVSSRKTKLSEFDLDDTQKKAMDAFVKRGVLTKEQYLDSLAKSFGMK